MKNEKMLHFIAVTAFVFFIVLGLACASTPAKPEVPQDYAPPPKPVLNLTQEVMEPNDPRMPVTLNQEKIQAWEQFGNTKSFINLPGGKFSQYSDWRIDGHSVEHRNTFSILGNENTFSILEPGKHSVSYKYTFSDNSVYPLQHDIVMKAGKAYSFYFGSSETTRSHFNRTVLGDNTATYNLNFNVREENWERPKEDRRSDKFLVPYDESVPIEQQAFLSLQLPVFVVSFNGKPVCWGTDEKDIRMNIGVPAGTHTLQLVEIGDGRISTQTISCTPGSVHLIYQRKIKFEGDQTFNKAASQSSVVYDGPSITIVNRQDPSEYNDITHIFISPVVDTNWGLNRLNPNQIIKREKQVTFQLPVSPENRYDILLISRGAYVYRVMNVGLTTGSTIIVDGNPMTLNTPDGKSVAIDYWR